MFISMGSDKNSRVIGAPPVIPGILTILPARIIYSLPAKMKGSYVTTSTGIKIPIPCGWTARAETGVI